MNRDSQSLSYQQSLFEAVKENALNKINELVKTFAVDVNVIDADGISLLHWAVASKDRAIVTRLLDYGADIACRDGLGETPLHYAIDIGPVMVQLLLMRGAKVDPIDERGRTPLYCAYRMGFPELDPSYSMYSFKTANSQTSLYRAVCKILERNKADFNKLLFGIAFRGGVQELSKYIANGFVIDIQDEAGRQVIHYAAAGGRIEMFTYLLSDTLKLNVRNLENLWLSIALGGQIEIAEKFLVVFHFTYFNTVDELQRTALHLAVIAEKVAYVKWIVGIHKVDIHALDKHGYTALDYAKKLDHDKSIKMLDWLHKEEVLSRNCLR